jgi:mannose-6-phosphate isomerase-like protein (cupin superfamily)
MPATLGKPRRLPPPKNGTKFRVVEYPPDAQRVQALRAASVAQEARAEGYVRDTAHARHPGFHKTDTIDYAIVLSGEIYALMDEGEVLLKAGDVLIQRGTNHAWSNRTGEPCCIAFVLIDAKPV